MLIPDRTLFRSSIACTFPHTTRYNISKIFNYQLSVLEAELCYARTLIGERWKEKQF